MRLIGICMMVGYNFSKNTPSFNSKAKGLLGVMVELYKNKEKMSND